MVGQGGTHEGNPAGSPHGSTADVEEGGLPRARRSSLPSVRGLVPPFDPLVSFFHHLRVHYQGVRIDKLQSLQDFQQKIGESLRESYTRMRRLIAVTQGVTDAQAVQYWYHCLD